MLRTQAQVARVNAYSGRSLIIWITTAIDIFKSDKNDWPLRNLLARTLKLYGSRSCSEGITLYNTHSLARIARAKRRDFLWWLRTCLYGNFNGLVIKHGVAACVNSNFVVSKCYDCVKVK